MPEPFNFQALVRPNVRKMVAYTSARSEHDSSVEEILLDANESPNQNPYLSHLPGHNRYPDPQQRLLKAKIAEVKSVAPDQIFLGNGSDEAIDLLMRAIGVPGHSEIIIQAPTYGMYEVCAHVNDLGVVEVPLGLGFQTDPEAVVAAITPATRLIFFCNPNNPTGNLIDTNAIRHVLARYSHGLVVVDEAYLDFADAGRELSMLPTLAKYPNLVVLQTFSKAWGLAGIRLGGAYASPEIIATLNKIKFPYNLNVLSQQAALTALAHPENKSKVMNEIIAAREALVPLLQGLPLVEKIYPSDTNFLLVKMKDAAEVYAHLLRAHVVVRDRSRVPGLEGCLRISIGTPLENSKLMEALHDYARQPA